MANDQVKKKFDVFMDLKSVVSLEIEGDNKNEAGVEAQATLNALLTELLSQQEYQLSNGKVIKLKLHHHEIEPFASVHDANK